MTEYNRLERIIKKYTKKDVVVAFSGGVDSSLILKLAAKSAGKQGTKVYALTVHTRLHPMNDIEISKRVANEMGVIHKIIYVDEMEIEGISNNPINRCYLCKKYIFTNLQEFAKKQGIDTIIEGTNTTDLLQYRPGIQALKELGIKSPFLEANCSKEVVKELAKKLNISVKTRPSAPCMATRFPYGDSFDYSDIERIDYAEEFIRDLGFYNVRIRKHKNIARIEVDKVDLVKFIDISDKIIKKVKEAGFDYVCLDLEGFRSGSMDLHLK